MSDSKILLKVDEIMSQNKAKILNLNNNFLTEIGIDKLLKKICKHPSLQKISATGNYIGENITDIIKTHLPSLRLINHFDFAGSKCMKDKNKVCAIVTSWRKLSLKVEV